MDKEEAIKLIDKVKNEATDPVFMLNFTWIRVIMTQIPDEEWERALIKAAPILGR